MAQLTLQPGLLLKNKIKNNTDYNFFIFQDQSINLYSINPQQEYEKIWSYEFLQNKKIEPVSLLFGDVTGNGESELIVLMYVFGQEPQIYIFPTNRTVPTTIPKIYNITSLRKGSRPMQAELIEWDGDKDKEIIITLSSPDRKIILLDYNINTLTPIPSILADEFMSTTYGPVYMEIADYNQDFFNDIMLHTKGEDSRQYIYLTNTQKETITTLTSSGPISTIHSITTPTGVKNIISNSLGEIYLDTENKRKQTLNNKLNKFIKFKNNTLLFVEDNIIYPYNISFTDDNTMLVNPQERNQTIKRDNYIYNKNENVALFYNDVLSNPQILFITNPITVENLQTQKKETIKKSLTETEKINQKRVQTEVPPPQDINIQDTIYVNFGDSLKIPMVSQISNNIKSVETTTMPQEMFLDPTKPSFIWYPNTKDIGEHFFEYILIQETEQALQINTQDSSKLSLERVSKLDTLINKHLIIVNDIPQIQITNPKDTINITGYFSTNYTIQDKIYLKEHKISVLQPKKNSVLIDNETIYWEPQNTNIGPNDFILEITDGISTNLATISVFVDTTINIKKHKAIATLNTEFVHQLPYQPQYQYTIIKAPPNLRISPTGEIHWIPLPTHVDSHIIEIDINTGSQIEYYELNVYVNAPPIISYRPANNEYITQQDTFMFNCQSFDLNIEPSLQWGLEVANPEHVDRFKLTTLGEFSVITDSLLDNQNYTIILSDGIHEDRFFGTLYVNSLPKIVSTPPDYLILGDTLIYQIKVEDLNKEKPFTPQFLSSSQNSILYNLNSAPINATLDSTGLLFWVPNTDQLGSHSFDISVADSLTTLKHNFTLFVNDKPSITSVDSLSIMVGDTLNHFFDASDLNGESNLIYSIKTTIDELIFSGKAGKLTWIPQQEDLGLHTLEINVSDGFSASGDTQKLKIFVYIPPTLTNIPDSTAYTNLKYVYSPKAYDMYQDSIINQDIFIDFVLPDTLFTGNYNKETNILSWVPTVKDLGLKRLEFIIKDKYNTTNHRFYDINVLISPCETLDTLYINTTDTVYLDNKGAPNQKIIIKNRSPFSPFP